MPLPLSFLLWICCPHPDRSKLKPPSALLTAGSEREISDWRQTNEWADAVPLIRFGGSELSHHAVPYQWPLGSAPWQVDGVRGLPLSTATPENTRAAMLRTVAVSAMISARIVGPVWEICAGASEGLLAIGSAVAKNGWGVALDRGTPSILTAAVARDFGVSITVRETDLSDPYLAPQSIRSFGGV